MTGNTVTAEKVTKYSAEFGQSMANILNALFGQGNQFYTDLNLDSGQIAELKEFQSKMNQSAGNLGS